MTIRNATLILSFQLALFLLNGGAQTTNSLSSQSSIPEGTRIVVTLVRPLDMRVARTGDVFTASIDSHVVANDQILVPEGSEARGHVTLVKRPSRLKQLISSARPTGEVDLALDEVITPDGVKYLVSGDLANPEEFKYIPLIPAGYGLTFVIKQREPHQNPNEVAIAVPEQMKSQGPPASEPIKGPITAQTQPTTPDIVSNLPTVGGPAQPHLPLTPAQAKEKAQALLGGPPVRVECYFSEEEKLNYLAFSSGSEVWLYKESRDSQDLRQQWHEAFDVFRVAPEKFFLLPGEKLPLLCLKGVYGGSGAGNTRLAIYCVESDSLSWVDYQEDWSVGGHPRITLDDKHVSDPLLRKYLESWAHAEGIDSPRIPSDSEDLRNVEQAWIDANGYMTSGIVKMCFYKGLKERGELLRLDDKHHVVADVPDGRYVWYSIFKGPVGGYDKVTGQYFMVYVPASRYDWATRLKVVGPWIYIAPNNENWKLRFNKTTHKLEQGDFGGIVDSHGTSVRTLAPVVSGPAGGSPGQKNVATPTIHPYDLLQNPFAYRGKVVQLDVGSWPYVLNGRVYQWAAMVGITWGGVQFEKMLTENEALYDVKGLDMNDASSGLHTFGQLVVLLPNANSQPYPGKVWLVRPLGVEAGTNYFGAVIQIPMVQFLRYAE